MNTGTLCISLDLGGSGARGVALLWPDGPVVPVRAAARNLRSIDDAELLDLLRGIIAGCRAAGLDRPALWLIGAAGARPDHDPARVARLLDEARLPSAGVEVFPDMLGNWAAALGGEDGIVTVNGTGSILFGRCDGREERRSGWGFLLDELPSGAALGRLALAGVLRAWEGHGETSLLAGCFRDLRGDWPQERAGVIDRLYGSAAPQKLLGTLSPVFAAAADAGCAWCNARLETALASWADEMRSLAESLGAPLQLPASGIGGLWDHWPAFSRRALQTLDERAPRYFAWQAPAFSSVWGPLIRHLVISGAPREAWSDSLRERAASFRSA